VTKRVAIVGLWHETNTYSTRVTTLADFASMELAVGEAVITANAGTGSVIGGFCTATGYELVPIFSAAAWPSGPADASTIESLLHEIEIGLGAAGQLDGVLVNLHGAMVAEGHLDVEASVLGMIRQIVGDVAVVAVLDLHANTSLESATAADVLISYDTYPHIDMFERGCEAAAMMGEMLQGRHLRTAIGRHPLLLCPLSMGSDDEPMQSLVARGRARAQAAGLSRLCITGGFAYSDVERAGVTVTAVYDEGLADAAREVVAQTLADVDTHRAAFRVACDPPAAAVRRALQSDDLPVVLVDVGDNIGGGSAGDGTALLHELMVQGADGAVVTIADRVVALEAHRLGVGASIAVEVGGRTDTLHGSPVQIVGHVVTLSDGHYRTKGSWMTDREFSMGLTAVIEVGGVRVVVTERPTPPFHGEQLSSVGIDVATCRIVTAKGAIAWKAAFGDVAGEVIQVDSPGVCPIDPWELPRQHAPQTLEPSSP